MTIAGVQLAELSKTRAYQDLLAIGREEGREQGLDQGREEGLSRAGSEKPPDLCSAVAAPFRQRDGRAGHHLRDLPTAQLEALGDALLDLGSTADLEIWLAGCRDR